MSRHNHSREINPSHLVDLGAVGKSWWYYPAPKRDEIAKRPKTTQGKAGLANNKTKGIELLFRRKRNLCGSFPSVRVLVRRRRRRRRFLGSLTITNLCLLTVAYIRGVQHFSFRQ